MDETDPSAAMLARKQNFYNNPTFSDIRIHLVTNNVVVEDIFAHKIILNIASPWFQDKLGESEMGFMAVRGTLAEHNATKLMLRYIYGIHAYPAPDSSSIYMDIELLLTAENCQVFTLAEQARKSITQRLNILKDGGAWGPATCATVLGVIYALPKDDGSLRRLACEACQGQMVGLVEEPKFQKALLDYPEIAVDLLKRAVSRFETPESNNQRQV